MQVDLSEVTFVDSVGLGVLLTWYRRARAAGGSLTVVNPDDRVLRMLRMTGLTRLLVADPGGTRATTYEQTGPGPRASA